MSVSSMFTQGWLDDPAHVTVTVIVDALAQAQVAADSAFRAGLAGAGYLAAVVAGDTAFSGIVAPDSTAVAALEGDGELQVQVSESAIRAIVTCD